MPSWACCNLRMLQLGQSAPDLRADFQAALCKLEDTPLFLCWHPVSGTILFVCVFLREIVAQKNADGIHAMIISKLLTQDQQALCSTLWCSETSPPDLTGPCCGRLPLNTDQATSRQVVGHAACWVLSEVAQSGCHLTSQKWSGMRGLARCWGGAATTACQLHCANCLLELSSGQCQGSLCRQQ